MPQSSENGLNIFGLVSGRLIIASDSNEHLIVTWNESKTFQVWSEDGGWFTELDLGWTAQEVSTLAEAYASAIERLKSFHES